MDFPGDPAVNSLPAVAGDTCLIPGSGRFHMLQDSCAKITEPAAPQSICSTTREGLVRETQDPVQPNMNNKTSLENTLSPALLQKE